MIQCVRDKNDQSWLICDDGSGNELTFKCREPQIPNYNDIPGGFFGAKPSQSISCYGKRYISDALHDHPAAFIYSALGFVIVGIALAMTFQRRR